MTRNPMTDRFWLHVGPRAPEHTSRLALRTSGLVLEPPKKGPALSKVGDLAAPYILQHRGIRDDDQLSLIDAEEKWLMRQDNAAALTSQTVWISQPSDDPVGDLRGHAAALEAFTRLARLYDSDRPLLGVVAISSKWLTKRAPRTELIGMLQDLSLPIGLMLGNQMDPLNSPRAVEGIIVISQGVDNLYVLRSDHGALGAYAYGAMGGSIGLNPTTRHYVPIGDHGWADNSDPTPRVLLPNLMEWWKGSRLGLYEGDTLFDCKPCPVCMGSSLARFQDETLAVEAEAHNVESWSRLAEVLFDTPKEKRPEIWTALCQQADAYLMELEDRLGLLHQPSRQLSAWLRVAGVPAT